ncbi:MULTISPECIES: amino acid adenylation domain-containing protein [unclassified Pseudomonas]|uniref:amino acid adenylation domain-containing protein n=1 Tax=unclassified Pseudomonas TaxID=196821 RepID=UPI0024471598|nr:MULTISPECIES: amino acid adenylation domain-containing protein [unclassified Pseudomonas]MDH0305345.1 amino acid adenylation domain-containing protein [Pseudomonas sp. GD04091]MDH1988279.1 amino acid adenylation domain-containing protein [Pseudomonas sp. GD03689]
MRRLDILMVGTSPTLGEFAHLLDEHGHGTTMADCGEAVRRQLAAGPDLVVEDGSLALGSNDWQSLGDTPLLRLRLGASFAETLPRLEILCWCGSAGAQRLIDRVSLPSPVSGNGQQLRADARQALADRLALHITRHARNPQYLQDAAAVSPGMQEREHGLDWLEGLAYRHPFNRTLRADLLEQAEGSLVGQLEHSLRKHAGTCALNQGDQRYSYHQLHARAVGIQRALLPLLPAAGQQPVVAVCMDKSPELYASLLAVLGCAAIYLPLDPATPSERRQRILEDANACVLLHDGQGPVDIFQLDVRGLPQVLEDPLPNLTLRETHAEQPCAAIYTSGTTGQPKGVLLGQRNLAHFSAWYREHVALDANSRVLQFSTIGFDASLLDILPTFICGAELVLPNEDQRRDPQQLVQLIHSQEISHAFLPPALLSILPRDTHLGLRHLITGGDVCEPEVIARLAGQCRMHNIYGPTETTVLATTRVFGARDGNRNLGLPIANTQVLILDEALQPVLEQVPGELYIAGPGVGIGYLNNPTLSAERFIALALPDGRSLRAYRTGDIGKWTEQGIELCGRRDNQVKIRGFRVEPEEIEHCLRDSRLFGQVAVVIDAQRRILAFVAHPEQDDAEERLREHAERYLPDYMRPMFYQALEQMPYTANGKVDRHALSIRPLALPSTQRLQPRTATEQRLRGLWSELLELPEADISIDDSFFNLGGHSILLSRLLLEIRQHFGRGVAINRFIEQPTLQRLGALLDGDDDALQTSLARLEQDANRELGLQVLPVDRLGDVHKVIVTGANSFLGVHLVEALLEWGASEVACLVRSTNGMTASERFAQSQHENRITLDLSRVRVFEADLRKPRLGLAQADYDYLDSEYGALLHNAAQVNHVLDYQVLAADNIEPLFECLRLCEGRRKKIFNFVSTLSACSAVDHDGRVLESDPANTPPIYIRNGYNLSKWVGERILSRAREQGVWVNVFRPGNITFDSRTGACQPSRNRLMLMLKGSLQLGQVPGLEIDFDLMPVDFLSRFIAFHASRHQAAQCVFNLHNPEPLRWRDYLASFREQGHAFELVSIEQWQRQLGQVDRDNALYDVLGFYLDGFEEDIGDISGIAHDNARAGVNRMGTHYPSKSPELLRRGCRYLADIGFI